MKPAAITGIVFAVLLLIGGGIAGWLAYTGQLEEVWSIATSYFEDDDGELLGVAPVADPEYMNIEPPFLVNFEMNGQLRWLQVSLSVMSTDPLALEDLQRHMPVVRNNLLLIFSDQTLETMLSRDAKEALRVAVLEEIRFVLTQITGVAGVEDVYFTSFVMQ